MTTRLASLVRKELVRPDKPQFPGEDAFRFRHVLIREAAYDSLPKSTRAELHERFAGWLAEYGHGLVEFDELLGYHLEQAYRCRVDLGLFDDRTAALGAGAADRLAAAGRRAAERQDTPAAINLLERAAAMRPDDDPGRLQLLPLLARALVEAGGWERAKAVVDEASERGRATGDRRVAADAVLELSFLRVHTDLGVTHRQVEADLAQAARDFEALGDQVGVARALTLAGRLPFWRGDTLASMEQEERAAAYARAAGSRIQEIDALTALLFAMVEGPSPVAAISERLDQVEALTSGSSRADVFLRRMRADVDLMLGDVEGARAWVTEARALAEELGLTIVVATGIARTSAEIELFTGDLDAVEREMARACNVLRAADDWGHIVSQVPFLMDALFPQGRAEELASLVDEAWERMIEEDVDAQIGMRRARSKLLASRGDLAGAEALAREALALSGATSYAIVHAKAHEHLAEILRRMGRDTDAAAARREAVAIYERKGCVGFAERASAAVA